jgi:hypothetical protein
MKTSVIIIWQWDQIWQTIFYPYQRLQQRSWSSQIFYQYDLNSNNANCFVKNEQKTRGRCYDHNCLQYLPIFGEQIGVFSKTNVMIHVLHNLALFWAKNDWTNERQFCRNFATHYFRYKNSVKFGYMFCQIWSFVHLFLQKLFCLIRNRCYDFKNIFAEKFWKNWRSMPIWCPC